MKFAIKNICAVFTILILLTFPIPVMHAGEFYSEVKNQPFNVAQNKEEGQSFELSAGQIRSRVEHKLVNLLLGHTIDQYLDFGPEDDTAKKSSQRLKIRVDEHQFFLIYYRQFE